MIRDDLLHRYIVALDAIADVFNNDYEAAHAWLTTPHNLTFGHTPQNLLITEEGVIHVAELINKLKYGVFS